MWGFAPLLAWFADTFDRNLVTWVPACARPSIHLLSLG